MEFYTSVLTLFLVLDPVGNVPILLGLLKSQKPKQRNRIILRETGIAFLVLVFFLFFGRYFLDGLHITMPALEITGAIILFIIALRMVFPRPDSYSEKASADPLVVPIAIPLTSGPASITTVMLFAGNNPEHLSMWFFSIVVAFIAYLPIVLAGPYLEKWLGQRGIEATARLAGMLLIVIAVQMFLSGIGGYLHTIHALKDIS